MSHIDRIQKFSGMWYYRGEQTKAFTIVGQACVCKSFGEDEEGEAALMIVYEGKEKCYPDIITREQFRAAPVHPEYLSKVTWYTKSTAGRYWAFSAFRCTKVKITCGWFVWTPYQGR